MEVLKYFNEECFYLEWEQEEEFRKKKKKKVQVLEIKLNFRSSVYYIKVIGGFRYYISVLGLF